MSLNYCQKLLSYICEVYIDEVFFSFSQLFNGTVVQQQYGMIRYDTIWYGMVLYMYGNGMISSDICSSYYL